ncbi:MAG: MFS transporter, partial [Methanothrix sp.]|nr:MFS transporter [Methanothrix sp.]
MSDAKTGRNILLLGLVSLLNDISSEIIQPVLPLFIASLGGGTLAVGLVGGFSEGLPSLIKLFSGCWSDRMGRRKPLVVGGYALSALGKILLAAAESWLAVFLAKSLERCGKGLRSGPRDAMISESVAPGGRGRGFGLHRAMDSTGAVIGSLLAYSLWQMGFSYSSIFLVAGVLALLALLPFAKVKESYSAPKCEYSWRLSDIPPDLGRFLAIACLFALGNFSYMFFILRAQGIFSGAEATASALLLYALFNSTYALLALPVGIWSDRIGRKRILALGYALFALTALGFALVTSPAGLIILFALYGLVYALVDGSERAFVSDLSPPGLRGSALGLYSGALGLAAIASSLLAGAVWQWWGPEATFFLGAGAAVMAAVGMMVWRK